jgi:hypothetical protein
MAKEISKRDWATTGNVVPCLIRSVTKTGNGQRDRTASSDKHKQRDGKIGNGLGVHDPRKCRASNWIILDKFNRGHAVFGDLLLSKEKI